MTNPTKTILRKLLPYRLFLALLFTAILAISPGQARPLSGAAPPDPRNIPAKEGEDIYLVIKPELSKELLETAVDKLKKRGITVSLIETTFHNGRLAAIDISIDVQVPGKPKTSYRLSEKANGQTFQPLIFYYESTGAKVGFVKGAPEDLSPRGKLVVNDNLVGLAILYGDSMELAGSASTRWK